jgi:uncharacterized membrane protein YvbJ
MWRCARCGARNSRQAAHCGQCGMPSPFADGGRTRTIDIPEIEPEPPRRQSSSLPWIVVGVVTLILLALLVVAVVALSG